MALPWRLTLFGAVKLVRGQDAYGDFETRRAAKLLVLLALSKTGTRRRDDLADLLWPDDFQDSTRLRLRQELSRLRRGLGDAAGLLQSSGDTVSLDMGGVEHDIGVLRSIEHKPGDDLLRILSQEFLPGWDDSWVEAERVEVDALRARVAESVATRLLDDRQPEEALAYSQLGARWCPDCEPLRLLMMKAHAAMGSLTDAVSEYRRFKRESHTSLTEGEALAQVRPAMVTPVELPRAPHPIDRFFGRDSLLHRLIGHMEPSSVARLVTVVGAGGIGKTRLVIEAVHRSKCQVGFVSFVECAPNDDPVAYLQEQVFQGHLHSDPLEVLRRQWAGQKVSLVLDNLEHLEAPGAFVHRLLTAIPDLRLFVTSRRLMKVAGEVVVKVSPMNLESEALPFLIDLASQNAQTVRDSSALRDLVARCDGMPLTLRLAAARLRFLEPDELVQELDGAGVLRADLSDLPVRQRDLARMIGLAYEGLSAADADALLKLAQFPAGVTRSIAKNFLGDGVDETLERLIDSALVWVDDEVSPLRFRLLEPVRQYLRQTAKPESWAEARDTLVGEMARYVSFYVPGWQLTTVEELAAHQREAANIRAALELSEARRDCIAHDLFRDAWHHELSNGRSAELLQIADRLIEWPDATAAQLGNAWLCKAWCLSAMGQIDEAASAGERAYGFYAEAGDEAFACYAKMTHYEHLRYKSPWPDVLQRYAEVEAIAERVAPSLAVSVRVWRGLALTYRLEWDAAAVDLEFGFNYSRSVQNSGMFITAGLPLLMVDHVRGDHARRREREEEIRVQVEELNDPHQWSMFERSRARFALVDEDYAAAEAYARHGLQVFAFSGNLLHEVEVKLSLARSLIRQGRLAEARDVIHEISPAVGAGLRRVAVVGLACLGELSMAEGRAEEAAVVVSMAKAYRDTYEVKVPVVEAEYVEQVEALIGSLPPSPPMSDEAVEARLRTG